MFRIVIAITLFLASLSFGSELIKFEIDKDIDFIKFKRTFEANNYQIETTPRLEKPFRVLFNNQKFDTYRVIAVYEKDIGTKLVEDYPDSAILTPFNIALMSKKGEDKSYVIFISADAIAKTIGANGDISLIKKLEQKNISVIKKIWPNAKRVKTPKSNISINKTLKYTRVIKNSDINSVIEKFETDVEGIGFRIINYLYLKDISNNIDKEYKEFVVLSLCKKRVLNIVSKAKPDAIAFAPCSVMIREAKGSGEIVVSYPTLTNWIKVLNIKNKDTQKYLYKEQENMTKLIESL
jgi:uncharacterized protein (DUF302 family)